MSESANSMYQSNGMISSLMPQGITARENMIFQEYLSNTALQRQMADAKAAGLNPWLMNINGASTPSGAVDSAEVLQALAGSSAHGYSQVEEESALGWTSIFGALGMKKFQAQSAGAICDALGITPEEAMNGIIATGGNVWKFLQNKMAERIKKPGPNIKSESSRPSYADNRYTHDIEEERNYDRYWYKDDRPMKY